jgi:hypothetical protein
MRERSRPAPSRHAAPARPVQCRVCTIYIGEGYEETHPIPLPDAAGHVCWRCYESLRRQVAKRAASEQRS